MSALCNACEAAVPVRQPFVPDGPEHSQTSHQHHGDERFDQSEARDVRRWFARVYGRPPDQNEPVCAAQQSRPRADGGYDRARHHCDAAPVWPSRVGTDGDLQR